MIYYKEMALEHYDNDVILNSPEVQAMRTVKENGHKIGTLNCLISKSICQNSTVG